MADTLDVLTLDEAKAALNITGATFDTELASYITAVSQRLDDICGPIVQRTVTDEAHDGGTPVIWPYLAPVASIVSVVEYVSGTDSALAAETPATSGDYVLANAGTINSQIRRRSGWATQAFAAGTGNILVTYVAGRFATTAVVAPKFKQAAAIFLSHLWRFEQGQGSATFGGSSEGLGIPSFGTPNAVRDLVAAELRGPAIA